MIRTTKHESLDDTEGKTEYEYKKTVSLGESYLNAGVFEDAKNFVIRDGSVYYKTEMKSYRDHLLYNIPIEQTFVTPLPKPLDEIVQTGENKSEQKTNTVYTETKHGKLAEQRVGKFSRKPWRFSYRAKGNHKKMHHKDYQRDRSKKYVDPAMERPEDYDYEDYDDDYFDFVPSDYDYPVDYYSGWYEDDDYGMDDFDDDDPFDDLDYGRWW
jgi:hypothetical protein